jgi:diguanylate cyclase (GGDEF)-like protein/PAS domain S-box-containing protein
MEKNSKILIVDDDVALCDIVEQVISHFLPESVIIKTHFGLEGLKLAEFQSPDVIILDVNLPDIDGFEVCRRLRENPATQSIAILIVTGLNQSRDIKIELLELGADAFLNKPFDDSELVAQLKALLRLKNAEDKIRSECLVLKDEVDEKERSLSIQEERWKLILENIAEGIWDWDLRSNDVFLSNQWKEMLGYRADEVDNTVEDFLSLIHASDYKRFQNELDSYLKRLIPEFSAEIRMKCGNGSYRWFLFRGCGIWDDDDRPIRVLGIQTDITEYKEKVFNLETMALFDCLTGLPNRVLFYELVEKAMHATKRTKQQIGIMFIDLDNFKEVNDNYGHSNGDVVLKTLADRFLKALRPVDVLARFGGDEFVMAIADLKDRYELDVIVKRLREAVSTPVTIEDRDFIIDFSVGYSIFPEEGKNIDKLLVLADQRMYKEKEKKQAEK